MRDLTFFTTNQSKLAHARYLAEGRRFRIVGFRQKTYHAGYNEPRLSSRAAILQASYASALEQLEKAGFSRAVHPFILEDTSVRIEALSAPDKDVPGVDVKYWMADQTFASLDAELRLHGNDRRAVVRSDVLLHVPSSLKKTWGTSDDHIVFTGFQRGSVADVEIGFETNPVFPWLDFRSFNRWFVPEGAHGPLGNLPISDADRVDFRRESFGALFDFLDARNFSVRSPSQLRLQLERSPDILLCGYTCSGKTTASQRLAKRSGYLHVEASDFMHIAFYERHGFQDAISIGDFAEKALEQKPTIAAERVADYIADHPSEPAVISGFRALSEIDLLAKVIIERGRTVEIRFVSAEERTRYDRMRARLRPGDDLTPEQFRARDLQQQRMGLDRIRNDERVVTLANEVDLESYYAAVDRLTGAGGNLDLDVDEALNLVATIADLTLQQSILFALLRVWRDDETRRFYSTTEIAGLIATMFQSAKPKHKDNVSRFFNQDFYAYFEISRGAMTAPKRYRLSNTGYGMAIRELRSLLDEARARC